MDIQQKRNFFERSLENMHKSFQKFSIKVFEEYAKKFRKFKKKP